jgi:hypothetical protein
LAQQAGQDALRGAAVTRAHQTRPHALQAAGQRRPAQDVPGQQLGFQVASQDGAARIVE